MKSGTCNPPEILKDIVIQPQARFDHVERAVSAARKEAYLPWAHLGVEAQNLSPAAERSFSSAGGRTGRYTFPRGREAALGDQNGSDHGRE